MLFRPLRKRVLTGLPYSAATTFCSALAAWFIHHQWVAHLSAAHAASPTLFVLRATNPAFSFLYVLFAVVFYTCFVCFEPIYTWHPLPTVRRCTFWSSLFIAAFSPFGTLLSALSP